MVKSAFISCISRLSHAVLSLPMRLQSPKTPQFGKIFNARISASAAFKVSILLYCHGGDNHSLIEVLHLFWQIPN
ncbi:hypothetical protein Y032_0044g912 [Ancylostoma ceylanicum]|uniref:Uncharacterized protein n=1 Tax=Ancylostoma ceylanicum TaxID=53326 RepID=A0A016UEG2_9BILA|nr:hypothetical protein Y032_0044g912 [Ancylostoma ceylanicum]